MDDERIERLLRGYRLPDVSGDLDARVLRDGRALIGRGRTRSTVAGLGRLLLDHLGFGYLTWLADLITSTDAEYRVEFI
jgi:hypothetical protein